jgi:hypothetical protein
MRRLDIDPKTVALMPTEPAEILTRCLGGKRKDFPRKQVFAYCAASTMPVCRKFLDSIGTIGKVDLAMLSFEAMCVKAAVSPLEMLGAILMSAKSLKATESALKVILAHPDVIDTTVETAKISGPAGYSDRRMLHETVGFLPTKKGGMEINIGLGRPKEDDEEETDADDAWSEVFPPLGNKIQDWSENKHKLLEGGK